ncbi:DUF998 domain-containing protein [Candidatus Woesebacteria bacterium]|nr:DUF998 domain-containing protein [Candidatus Woesebacteria bacterium]
MSADFFQKIVEPNHRHYTRIFALCYVVFIATTLLLPFFSFQGYSILRNTTSHLGAQGSPNALVMNSMFAAIAISCFLATLKLYRKFFFHTFILIIFTISMLLVAVFQHEPLVATQTNTLHAALHSLFATTSGISFTLLAVATIFITKKSRDKFLAAGAGILATLLSIGMFAFPEIMGLLQRLILVTAYGWLLYSAKK